MYIRDDDLRRIARLWHELAEIPAARGDEALTHCFAQLAQIVGASNVFMVGAAPNPARPVDTDARLARLHRPAPPPRRSPRACVANTMRHFKANASIP